MRKVLKISAFYRDAKETHGTKNQWHKVHEFWQSYGPYGSEIGKKVVSPLAALLVGLARYKVIPKTPERLSYLRQEILQIRFAHDACESHRKRM